MISSAFLKSVSGQLGRAFAAWPNSLKQGDASNGDSSTAVRKNTAIAAIFLVLSAIGAGILLIPALYDLQPIPRLASKHREPKVQVARDMPQVERFDFGFVLIGGDSTLERVFSFKNASNRPFEIESVVGQPPCCVRTLAESSSAGDFKMKVIVKLDRKQEQRVWRGIAKTKSGSELVAEISAFLIPQLQGRLNDESVPEIDRNESFVRAGVLQYVGESKPEKVASSSSDSAVHWAIDRWEDRGTLGETKYRIWEAPVRAEVVGKQPGLTSTVNLFEVKPAQAQASIPLDWRVRSEWIVEPKVLLLSAGERQGRFHIAPRRPSKDITPVLDCPSKLFRIERATSGFDVVVERPNRSPMTMENATLKLGPEIVSLSVVFREMDQAVGDARR